MGTRHRARPVAAVVVAFVGAACSGVDTTVAPDSQPGAASTTTTTATTTTTTTTDPVPTTTPEPSPTASSSPTTSTTTAPAAPAGLGVHPATGLADGDIVVVTGTGLRQADSVIIGLCHDSDPLTVDDCEPAVFTRPEGRFVRAPDGTLESPVRIRALFTTRAGTPIDCRHAATACMLVAASVFAEDPLEGPYAAIDFDPSAGLAAPGVTVSATTDLHDGQPIGLSAWGFDPGAAIAIGHCLVTDGEPTLCETEIAVFAPRFSADGTGALDATVDAQLEFDAHDTAEPVSCRSPATCELIVESPYEDAVDHPSSWRFPLSFDSDARLAAPPAVSVTPPTGLVDGGRVDVVADALVRPARPLYTMQCSGPIGWESCDPTTTLEAIEPAPGEPVTILARALINTTDGRVVDCRTSSEACYIAVASDLDSSPRRWGTATLDFDPTAPLAPPPSVRIIGGADVEERDQVTIIGEGLVPNANVQVAQCGSGWFVPQSCAGGPWMSRADQDGRVEFRLTVFATAGPADCSTAAACEIRVAPWNPLGGIDERTSGTTPVTVQPLDADERYLEPVFDEVEHRIGIVYGRGLDNDGDEIDLLLDLYLPRGDDATDRPVIIWGGVDATEFARRGFVVVDAATNVHVLASRESIELAYYNNVPVLAWLADHADELRIDTGRIAAAGQSRGGFISTSLAYAPVAAGGEPPQIAAAVSMAGGSVTDLIEAGEPPSLMLHGEFDGRVPIGIAEETCRAAATVGVRCELVVYEGRGHEVGLWNDLIFDIWDRVGRFLVDVLDLE